MPAAAALASSTPWPLLAGLVGSAIAVTLWGLFRRGSVADRARRDEGDGTAAGSDPHGDRGDARRA